LNPKRIYAKNVFEYLRGNGCNPFKTDCKIASGNAVRLIDVSQLFAKACELRYTDKISILEAKSWEFAIRARVAFIKEKWDEYTILSEIVNDYIGFINYEKEKQ